MVKKYRKKPVTISAARWTGDNFDDLAELYNSTESISINGNKVVIHTLEGDMTADVGDYIIQGVHGELCPCKADIFYATYDLLEPERTNFEREKGIKD